MNTLLEKINAELTLLEADIPEGQPFGRIKNWNELYSQTANTVANNTAKEKETTYYIRVMDKKTGQKVGYVKWASKLEPSDLIQVNGNGTQFSYNVNDGTQTLFTEKQLRQFQRTLKSKNKDLTNAYDFIEERTAKKATTAQGKFTLIKQFITSKINPNATVIDNRLDTWDEFENVLVRIAEANSKTPLQGNAFWDLVVTIITELSTIQQPNGKPYIVTNNKLVDLYRLVNNKRIKLENAISGGNVRDTLPFFNSLYQVNANDIEEVFELYAELKYDLNVLNKTVRSAKDKNNLKTRLIQNLFVYRTDRENLLHNILSSDKDESEYIWEYLNIDSSRENLLKNYLARPLSEVKELVQLINRGEKGSATEEESNQEYTLVIEDKDNNKVEYKSFINYEDQIIFNEKNCKKPVNIQKDSKLFLRLKQTVKGILKDVKLLNVQLKDNVLVSDIDGKNVTITFQLNEAEKIAKVILQTEEDEIKSRTIDNDKTNEKPTMDDVNKAAPVDNGTPADVDSSVVKEKDISTLTDDQLKDTANAIRREIYKRKREKSRS